MAWWCPSEGQHDPVAMGSHVRTTCVWAVNRTAADAAGVVFRSNKRKTTARSADASRYFFSRAAPLLAVMQGGECRLITIYSQPKQRPSKEPVSTPTTCD